MNRPRGGGCGWWCDGGGALAGSVFDGGELPEFVGAVEVDAGPPPWLGRWLAGGGLKGRVWRGRGGQRLLGVAGRGRCAPFPVIQGA